MKTALDRRQVLRSLAAMTATILVGCNRSVKDPAEQVHTASSAVTASSVTLAEQATTPRDRLGDLLPLRKLGKSGPEVTMLGLGGHHVAEVSEADGQAVIEAAIEVGIRFFDTAVLYGDGESERRYGRFLIPRYRDVSFIMTKSHARSGKGMLSHLDDSLRRLACDYIDLWQMHDVQNEQEVQSRIDEGAFDALEQATRDGKVKHVGFTGHTSYKAHLAMLEHLTERGVEVISAQMPVNVVDPHYESFVTNVVPRCVERGIGILGIKSLAFGRLLGRSTGWARREAKLERLVPDMMSLDDALGFVWSLPISVLISGMESPAQVRQNAAIAKRSSAFSEAKRLQLIEAVRSFGGPGVEFYKA